MRPFATTLLMAMLLAAPLGAGIVYEIETTDHEQSPPRVESTEVAAEGRNLKMEVAPGQRGGRPGAAIFRGDRREMVIVDHGDQTYVVMDEAAVQQMAEQVAGVSAQIAEALKNVPEDQREMIEKMMKERMPQQAPTRPRSEVRRTGERAERSGYPCVKYEVYRDGRKTRELWVTGWSNVEGGDEVAGAFEAMAEFFQQMLDAMPAAGGAPVGLDDAVFAEMKELGGFPVVTRDFDADGSLEAESTLRSARRRTLDPSEFEPPAGYKRRTMFGPQ